jgi:hypothetical protein
MPQISRPEFERLPLRVHSFMNGVALHDAWAIDLPSPRSGITLEAFARQASERLCTPPPAVLALLNVRLFAGRLFGWDRVPQPNAVASFADRLSADDRARTLVPAGTRDGPFRIVYSFENEQLSEVINRTAHAAALSALIECENSYRYYFAVYVRDVSRLTPIYMTLIDPFRKSIVYPSLLRSVRGNWQRTWNGSTIGSR